jgi:hypothetical protein
MMNSNSTAKESPTLTELECILMLLMALCLEHARICHIWYAVLQVSPQLVPFLELLLHDGRSESYRSSSSCRYDAFSGRSQSRCLLAQKFTVCDMQMQLPIRLLLPRQDKAQ